MERLDSLFWQAYIGKEIQYRIQNGSWIAPPIQILLRSDLIVRRHQLSTFWIQLFCDYINKNYQNLRWGMAGKDRTALDETKKKLSEKNLKQF